MLDAALRDCRYALRSLRAAPGFTTVAILSLALGIGANTAIFSLIDAVILKSLPVHRPEDLFQVMMGDESYGGYSNPTWEHLRDRQDVFSGIFAYGRWSFNLAMGGEARPVNGNYVSGQYFETLGVHAVVGRTLTPSDDTRGCAGKAVLSYGFWQREYGGRPEVVGRTISIDRHPLEIVGVAQPGFNGTEVGGSADVMVPLCAVTVIRGGDASLLETNFIPVGWLQVIGRLKAGVSPSRAAARLKMLAPEIYRSTLEEHGPSARDGRLEERNEYLRQTFGIKPASNGISYVRREYRGALSILMAITGAVLLIACVNVANLLLARGASRQREIAIRVALGSGRGRLIGQFLTESLLLSGAGALLGLLFAVWGARVLLRFSDASLDVSLDARVLAFTVGVAASSGLLFGLAPAWRGARMDPQTAMKANSRGTGAGTKSRTAKILIVSQVALSLLLLVGAGLLISSLRKLVSQDAGFERDGVLLVSADLRSGNYPREQWVAVYQQMLEQLRAAPDVSSASVSSITPVCHCRWTIALEVEGYTPQSRGDSLAGLNQVSDRYFETLGAPILAGRDFDRRDTANSAKVAIVSRSMAQKYFGTRNPLGQRFRVRDGNALGDPVEIVGVVKDAKYGSLRDPVSPYVFLPWSQSRTAGPLPGFALRRASGDPAALIAAVKPAIASVNRDVSLDFKTLAGKVDESIEREKLLATLSGFFGALALLLASIGLYGVLSYNMARRRNEIGIRMALGARQWRVMRLVLGEVALLVGAGLIVGLLAALATTRLVANFLYDTRPVDATVFLGAAAMLSFVSAVAGFLPARRASRVDPITALREE